MDESPKGRGCLMLFALPFAAGGIFIAVMAVSAFRSWLDMRSWVEVPAKIVAVELKTQRRDGSTTFIAKARYTYNYEGKSYEGTRVGIRASADNIGNFHRNAVEELTRHKESDTPFRCFVNPRDPSESVLYRQLRVGLLVFSIVTTLIAGSVAGGLIVWSLKFPPEVTKRKRAV